MDKQSDCLVPKRKIGKTLRDEPPDKKVCSEISMHDDESLNEISENTDSVSPSIESDLTNNLDVKRISDELKENETLSLKSEILPHSVQNNGSINSLIINSCTDDGSNCNTCQESKDNSLDNELENHSGELAVINKNNSISNNSNNELENHQNGKLAEVNKNNNINNIIETAKTTDENLNIDGADLNDPIAHQPSTEDAPSISNCNNDDRESINNNPDSELKSRIGDSDEVNTCNSVNSIVVTAESNGENANPDGADLNDSSVLQPSTTNAQTIPREKCRYGSQCYRLNLEHKTKFSHPGDPDFDLVDNRPECPYGKSCYRKNDQHKLDYKHTENKRKKRKPAPRQSSPGALSWDETDEESVDESDEYEPSFIDDESEYELESDFEGDDI